MKQLYRLFRIQKGERCVFLTALLAFTVLVCIMVAYTTGWGNESVLRRGVAISGFDHMIYSTVKKWHIAYELLRHPLLTLMLWPLSVLDTLLRPVFGVECNAYIIGTLWVILDSYSALFLYRTLNVNMDMSKSESCVLTLFFFSLAFVLLTTIVPDHMAISLFLLSLTLYVATDRIKKKRVLRARHSLVYFLLCTGVTTTNGIKIILADFFVLLNRKMPKLGYFKHFMYYAIPIILLFGAYYAQDYLIQKPAIERRNKLNQKKFAKNSLYEKAHKKRQNDIAKFRAKQVMKGKLFEFTDVTIDRWKTITDNVFGEGLQLHRQHLLDDPHGKQPHRRPEFVSYENMWHYIMEVVLVALLIIGVVCGIRSAMLWIPLSWFIFDMVIHCVFNFAISDVFIMTAHWALLYPIALAYMLKATVSRRWMHHCLLGIIAVCTLLLYLHNGTLIISYLL